MMGDNQISEEEKRNRLLDQEYKWLMQEPEPYHVKRERELVVEFKAKSKVVGDFYWRRANAWSGHGDYVPGQDDGEGPRGS